MRKIEFLSLVALFFGCIGFLLWTLQRTGVYDVKGEMAPYIAKMPFVGYTVAEDLTSPLDLQTRELERIKEAIGEKEQVLTNKDLEIEEREKQVKEENDLLEQRRRQIRELEVKLAEREKQEDDRDQRLNRLVEIYGAMPPDAAAKQIESQDDELAIELLKRMKSDAVAIILSLMTKEHASTLVLKMGKPESVTQ